MKNISLTQEEIVRYWGSVDAYNEEQRRVGLSELEAIQFGEDSNLAPRSNLFPVVGRITTGKQTSKPRRSSFLHFGHKS